MRCLIPWSVAAAVATFTVAGCVKPGVSAPIRGSHYVISSEELARSTEMTLLEAVARLRPHFLKTRTFTAYGRAASFPLMLYVDGERMESIDDLRRFTPAEVLEVRFFEPAQANTRFARYNNAGGAVAITLKGFAEVPSDSAPGGERW